MFTQKRLRGQAQSVAFGMLKESLRGARGALQAPPGSLVRLQKIQGKYFMSIILEAFERLKIRPIVMAALASERAFFIVISQPMSALLN